MRSLRIGMALAFVTLAAAAFGAIGAELGQYEFRFLPLAGPGHFFLAMIRFAKGIPAGAGQLLAPLMLANIAGYEVLALLGAVGFLHAGRSRSWRTVYGGVIGAFAGILFLTLAFSSTLIPVIASAPVLPVTLVLAFVTAPVLGLLAARRLDPARAGSGVTKSNGMHWGWRVCLAVVIGYCVQEAYWLGQWFWTSPNASISGWLGIIGREPWSVVVSMALLTVPVGVFVALTWVYGPRRDYQRETLCRGCGYILRGISEPRCPECGERI